MPILEYEPSPAGRAIEVAPVHDARANSLLGKVDTITVDSGPDLIAYVEGELANCLSRMGFLVHQVERAAPHSGRKRVSASLLAAEVSSESTAYFPVVATARILIEVAGESSRSTFRREVRGGISRDLGFHTQGGPEDAQLLADAIRQALARLAEDEAFRRAALATEEPGAPPAVAPPRHGRTPEGAEQMPRERGRDAEAEAIRDRLSTLERLLDEGLIDRDDYDRKRKEILDGL